MSALLFLQFERAYTSFPADKSWMCLYASCFPLRLHRLPTPHDKYTCAPFFHPSFFSFNLNRFWIHQGDCICPFLFCQIRELLLRTINHFVDHLAVEQHLLLPELKLELILDEGVMAFFPPCSDFSQLLHSIVQQINKTMQKVGWCSVRKEKTNLHRWADQENHAKGRL